MKTVGFRLVLFFAILFTVVALSASPVENAISGFLGASSDTERQWENKYRSSILADNLRDYDQRLSARPHHVGSAYDKDNAEWMLAKFKEWGYDAHIETFDVLFPTPKERVLEMVAPTKYVAKLQEPALSIDPTSKQLSEQLPTYNAYSIDGDVTGPLVYVNDGSRDDYERLDRMGISVKGAIVIARYGEAWRGVKPKVAAEHGAIGCIIYSDPREDGYFEGVDYPEGGLRPKDGVQRGSVMDTDYPGDPLTPGVGATNDAKRLPIKEAKTITKIPVLPISYADAMPLLSALTGPVAPEAWRGGLPITYRIGPGLAKVHLKVTSNWDLKPVNDVIAKMPGSEFPDEWVIRGNHYDAWVNGASDPDSGMASVLEEARALGELHKKGWNPKRTIIFTAWDGEEPGLLGSTEWVETHMEELQQHTVAYINSDNNGRGYLRVNGSHSLENFINNVARDITDPEKNISVWKRAQLQRIANAKSAEDRQELRQRSDLRIGALGDGSDYTAFLHHAGIAAMDVRFGGEDEGGVYHSIYDDFYWYTHFSDTDFAYGRTLAQTAGTAVMRLADADVLPFEFGDSADTIRKYVKELQTFLKERQDEIRERNREIEEGVFTATADPKKTLVPPPTEEVPAFMNFAPLENGVEALDRSARRYEQAFKKASTNGTIAHASLKALNNKLILTERNFTSPDGLPDRPWFRHQIYAPGAYTGYGAKPIAAVREAMDKKDWKQADAQIPRIGRILEAEAAAIDAATAELEKTAGAQDASYQYMRVGKPADVVTKPIPGVMLMGGGKDLDTAFRWICERSKGGDFLVLRATGTDAYNPYIRDLCKVNSVATLVIPNRKAANEKAVAETIHHAEAIFISGGDQANYINFWKGTPVQNAINEAIARGVPIGGTSAGLAVLGEIVFGALNDTAVSKVTLADPFDKTVTLERDFLNVPNMKGIVTDTHFVARDRLGRLLTFMARSVRDGWAPTIRAIGIDERTAVAVEPDGQSSVLGAGAAYFYRSTRAPSKCEPGSPLSFPDVAVFKTTAGGGAFNLATWSGSGGTSYSLSVVDGAVKSTQSGNLLY